MNFTQTINYNDFLLKTDKIIYEKFISIVQRVQKRKTCAKMCKKELFIFYKKSIKK